MRYKERVGNSQSVLCYVVIHDVKAYLLKVEVGIGIDEGVAAQLNTLSSLLHEVLLQGRGIVGGIVAAEPTHVASQLYAQYFGIGELEVEVAIKVQEWQR